jgi:hypothetical protein
MPRTRQPVQAPTGQAYGQAGQQQASQRAIPLPQRQAPTVSGAPTGPQQQAAPPAGQAAGPQDLLQVATEFDPGITPLTAPSERMHEPVTAGLSLGPGPGPDIFSQPARANRSADVLTALAQASGNDAFLELAARIRRTGGMR